MDKEVPVFSRPVATWLYVGVLMVFIQIVLGGITRLTGSGLAITEWNIVTGILPPLNAEQWKSAFQKYQQTPQFKLLNADFSLTDFKFIFYWEWFHRLWARIIGFVFLIPFIVFLARKQFKNEMIRPLIILFLLGALQGAIGWIMVASGLVGDAVYVRPTKLALHFIFALGLLAYTFWFALKVSVPARQVATSKSLHALTVSVLLLMLIQLLFGALMAGHKAVTAAPTWPTINGEWVPAFFFKYKPALINFIENKLTIQFVHRLIAYILVIITIAWTYKAFTIPTATGYVKKTRWIPLTMVIIQLLLGVLTVLASVSIIPNRWGIFEWFAEFHQVIGMLYLLTFVWMLYIVRVDKADI